MLALLGTAAFFNQYDLGLFSLLLVQIQDDLAIPEARLGLLGSLIRVGSLLAFFVLFLADRRGRRSVLLWSILGYTAATAATALAPSYESFTLLQIVARLFISAEALLAIVVIVEEFGEGRRGWGIGILGTLGALGRGVSMLLFAFIEDIPFGWRGMYAIGVVPLLLVAYLRRGLPETRRFRDARAAREPGDSLRAGLAPLTALLRGYPRRFAAVAAVGFLWAFSNGSADFFLPKFVQSVHGWSPGDYAEMAIMAGAIGLLGFPVAGHLSDRFGRRRLGVLLTVWEPAAAIVLYSVFGPLLVPVFVAWVFASVGNDVVLGAFRSELFPTSARSTAAGAIAVVATLGAVLGLGCEAALYAALGGHWTAVRLIAATGFAMPLILYFSYPETSGRALERLSPEPGEDAQRRLDGHASLLRP